MLKSKRAQVASAAPFARSSSTGFPKEGYLLLSKILPKKIPSN